MLPCFPVAEFSKILPSFLFEFKIFGTLVSFSCFAFKGLGTVLN